MRDRPDAVLDLVRDVGDYLDRLPQEVAYALLLDDGAVYLPGRDVVVPREADVEESLVMP